MLDSSVVQRFWSRVERGQDCWLWTGAANDKGYGQLWVRRSCLYAHRISYELHYGEIPDGMFVDHRVYCPKRCVHPLHLRLATRKQNGENRLLNSNNVSGVQGVWFESFTGKWRAMVRHNGKRVHVGRFATLLEAENAVVSKRIELFTHNDLDRV